MTPAEGNSQKRMASYPLMSLCAPSAGADFVLNPFTAMRHSHECDYRPSPGSPRRVVKPVGGPGVTAHEGPLGAPGKAPLTREHLS